MKSFNLIFFILFTKISFSQKFSTDLEKLELKGNIKSVKETTVYPREKAFKRYSGISSELTCFFNSQGNLETEYWYFNPNMDSSKIIYQYDADQNKIGDKYCDINNGFCNNNIYTLDSKGQKILSVSISMRGDSIAQSVFHYDQLGNLIEHQIYAAYCIGGKLLYTYKYYYDENDNPIKQEYFTSDSSVFRTSNIIFNNHLAHTAIHIDNNGKKTETIYEYTFDEKGNWISQTAFVKGKVEYTSTREIIYW